MAHTTSNPKIHEGRNLKRFREMLSIKQDALAFELGEDWNQQKISLLEQKEKIDNDILEQVAAILKIPAEAIRNFDEEKAVNIISNTFTENTIGNSFNYGTIHLHPIEKIVQLHEEKIALYERMLKEKDEMMGRLERLIKES
ncbi:XRE family transcriptional regulator [Dyadobacter sp.]|uniref:XRE family transcriptional regulator n=1 Tax=Dyadobacter sp. TaxID=1914288 RepID=UPI003F6FBA7D